MIHLPHMKILDVAQNSENRVALDEEIRLKIHEALHQEKVSANEVVFLLSRMLAELGDAAIVAGHLQAAYLITARRGIKPLMGIEAIPAECCRLHNDFL